MSSLYDLVAWILALQFRRLTFRAFESRMKSLGSSEYCEIGGEIFNLFCAAMGDIYLFLVFRAISSELAFIRDHL